MNCSYLKITRWFLIYAILLSANELYARTPLECTDLWSATCLPENRSDGTGENLSISTASDRITESLEKGKKKLRSKVADFAKQPKNKYVLSLAMRHLGLPDDLCEDPTETARCRNLAENALFETSYQLIFSSSNPGEVRHVSLEAVAPILRNSSFLGFLKETSNEVMNSISSPERLKFVEDVAFERVRTQFRNVINELPIDEKMKTKMLDKLANINFGGTDCSNLGTKKFEPNAYYEPADNSIRLCQGIVITNSSEFAIVQSLAHEMGHAFDPCNMGDKENGGLMEYINDSKKNWEKQYPIPNVVQCLRQSNSVAAKVNSQAINPYNSYGMPGPLPNPGPGPGPTNPIPMPPNGNKASTVKSGQQSPVTPNGGPQYYAPYVYPYGGYMYPDYNQQNPQGSFHVHPHKFDAKQCNLIDQIGEAVPDWFASLVLPKYMTAHHKNLTPAQMRAGYSNAWAWACSNQDAQKPDRHPLTKDRVNRILAVAPQVREQMGCSASAGDVIFCDPSKAPEPPPETTEQGLMEDTMPVSVKPKPPKPKPEHKLEKQEEGTK